MTYSDKRILAKYKAIKSNRRVLDEVEDIWLELQIGKGGSRYVNLEQAFTYIKKKLQSVSKGGDDDIAPLINNIQKANRHVRLYYRQVMHARRSLQQLAPQADKNTSRFIDVLDDELNMLMKAMGLYIQWSKSFPTRVTEEQIKPLVTGRSISTMGDILTNWKYISQVAPMNYKKISTLQRNTR
jgi:flagellin-specific chaperone FliS